MLTVTILINGQPIITRSCWNKGNKPDSNEAMYLVDDNNIVFHNPDDGPIPLAKKLLDLVKTE